MAALLDNSRITIPFMPSLFHIALVKVALPMFKEFDYDTLSMALTDIQFGNSAAIRNSTENQEIIYIRAKKNLLLIPALLRKTVLEAVNGLLHEVHRWEKIHSFIATNKCSLYWRFDGTIDRVKTAQELVLNEYILTSKRFEIACMYCMEKFIQTNWAEVDASEIEIESEMERFWLQRMRDGTQGDWTQALVEHLDYQILPSSFQLDDIVTMILLNRSYRYLISLDDTESRIYPVPTCSLLFPLLLPEQRRQLFNFLQVAKFSDLRFCLSLVTQEEEEQILRTNEGRIARNLLCSYLVWPVQNLFLEMAERMWNYIDGNDFEDLLITILKFKKKKKDFDYGQLLEAFWNSSPDHFRESTKRRPFVWQEIDIFLNERI